MKAPNFFIIGAPKCGTTALHHYISEHQQVFVPKIKEPHFYCTDIPGYPRLESARQYENLFRGANDRHVAVGEASVFYLYSQQAVPAILKNHPGSKIIVMVRDPVEMAHSLHSQFLYGFREGEPSFEIAWNLQHERTQGRHIPSTCTCPEVLQYAKVCMLGEQVERLMQIVPRQQLLVIDFNDFKKSTRDVYVRVLAFLGIADDGRLDFPPVNANRQHSLPVLTRLMMHPPFPLNHLKSSLKYWFNLYDTRTMVWCYGKLQKKVPRQEISEALRAEMHDVFASDQKKLKSLMTSAGFLSPQMLSGLRAA